MNKQFIKYIILPKGIGSIVFKSYAYFIPFLYSLSFSEYNLQNLFLFLVIFFVFEFGINPVRYQLNDLVDYKEDQKREYHWNRPVGDSNKKIIIIAVILRFLLGSLIVSFFDLRLFYLVILFLLSQVLYDFFFKKHTSFLSVFAVSLVYPLRSLTVLYALKIEFNQSTFLILSLVFLYATYMVFQWRKNESIFIINKKLVKKPNVDFFINPKIDIVIFINLLLILVALFLFVISLVELNSIVVISIFSFSFVVLVSLINDSILKKILNQSHNLFIFFIFVILTFNKSFIIISVFVTVTLVLFWYHRIYVKKFARIYFKKNHYDKNEN